MTYDFVVGIDPSLTNTGISVMDLQGSISSTECIRPSDRLRGINRLHFIVSELTNFLNQYKNKNLFFSIEGPSYGSMTTSLFELGELSGLIQSLLVSLNYEFIFPSPKEAKMIFAGNGNADKKLMRVSANKLYPTHSHQSEHEIDATACAVFGVMFLSSLITKKTAIVPVLNLITRIKVSEGLISRPSTMKGKKLNAKYFLLPYLESLLI